MKPVINKPYIDGLLTIDPISFTDNRGSLFETFHKDEYSFLDFEVAQTYQSISVKNVFRGFHFQEDTAKIVRCVVGDIIDFAIDIRLKSKTYGQWFEIILSEENNTQLFIPSGFAHGFLTLSDKAIVHYHQNRVYTPSDEGCIIYNDPKLNMPFPNNLIISEKDLQGMTLEEYENSRYRV